MRAEALEESVRRRPGRHHPRGIKRKMSGYHIVTTSSVAPKLSSTTDHAESA
jgi:hypothetical protein